MKLFFEIFFFIFVFLLAFHLSTKKYLNNWKLIMVFGKKGAGKSTYLTKQAILHAAKGWTVYSSIDIPFAYKFNPMDIGRYDISPIPVNPYSHFQLDKSKIKDNKLRKLISRIFTSRRTGDVLVLIDEVGMIWDNRDHKNFPHEVRDWFKLQRHYKCKVILFSQSFDVDKKIRDLTDEMWLLQNKFRVFSYGKRIIRKLDIVEATGDKDSESKIVDQLKFDSFFFCFLGSRTLTFIPRWSQLFDSFIAPRLPSRPRLPYPIPFASPPLPFVFVPKYKSWWCSLCASVKRFCACFSLLSLRFVSRVRVLLLRMIRK